MALLPSITPAALPVKIDFKFFFDRAGVAAHISKAKRAGLIKAGYAVMWSARKSISKRGNAKPQLKAMQNNPNMTLRQLEKTQVLSRATRKAVQTRIQELRFREPSPAGSPPYTWTGALRNSITFMFDPATESVVVGGFMPGIERLVALHEHGGRQTMQAWAWIQPAGWRNNVGIIGWWAVGRNPRGRWEKMGGQWVRSFQYPKRPYMFPALMANIKNGKIAKGFGTSASMGGMPGG